MKRFKKISKLEILDRKTNLVWRSDYATDKTWAEAKKYAKSLGKPWRLPTMNELASLIEWGKTDPASDFPKMPSDCFWSSTPYDEFFAWFANFCNGYVYDSSVYNDRYVRCVRSGP